jgi:Secretion system C-terminal sorting domain
MKKITTFCFLVYTAVTIAQTSTLTKLVDSLATPGGYDIIESFNNKLYSLPFSNGGNVNEINVTTGTLTHVATLPALSFTSSLQYSTYSGNFIFLKGKTVAAISSTSGGNTYHIAAGLGTVDTLLKNHQAFSSMFNLDTMVYILTPKKNLSSNRLYVTNLVNPITMIDTNVFNNGGANEQIKKALGQKKIYYVTLNANNTQPSLKVSNGITKQILETLPNWNAYNFSLIGEINNEMYYTVYHRSPPNNDTTWIKKCDINGVISVVDTILRKAFASDNGLVMGNNKLLIPFKNELSPYNNSVIVYDLNTHTKIDVTQNAYNVRTYNWSQDNVASTHFYYNVPNGGGIDKTYISDGSIAGTFEYKTNLNAIFSANFETYSTYQSIGNKAAVCNEYPIANNGDELYIGGTNNASLYKLYPNRKSYPSHFEKIGSSLFFMIRDASFTKITVMKLDGCDLPINNPLTGINEVNKTQNNFLIYPNPSNGILNVKLNEELVAERSRSNDATTITITDVLGKVQLSKLITENNTQLDVSTFAKGIYFITVKTGDKMSTQKLIIN